MLPTILINIFIGYAIPVIDNAALEPEVPNADGNKAFLTLLREAYLAELYRLEKEPTPDAERVAKVRRNLSLIGGTHVGSHPDWLVFTPDGRSVYVANAGSNQRHAPQS